MESGEWRANCNCVLQYTLYTLPRVLGARATTICPMTSAVRVAIDTEGQETIFERNYKQKYVAVKVKNI